MFLPDNNFKFVNLSVVTYKHKETGDVFEVVCFPNKLYEYFKNKRPEFLEEHKNDILQSENVYRNVSKGEISNKNYLIENILGGKKDKLSIIKFILDNGYERKDKETARVEFERLEKEILCIVQDKIKYKGDYLNLKKLKEVVQGVYAINANVNVKKQVSEIIKRIEQLPGYSRAEFSIKIFRNREIMSEMVVTSDKMHEIMQKLDEEGVDYSVNKIETESTEIVK